MLRALIVVQLKAKVRIIDIRVTLFSRYHGQNPESIRTKANPTHVKILPQRRRQFTSLQQALAKASL